ncbi:hypothetical protein RDI58_023485 [Solanum bulbocastanum]|uniref:Uncharacterized protein n=1 Tax=Solanum bulbocastanum TaxID=147425 RepID=A0AAN8Y765_SOLBU
MLTHCWLQISGRVCLIIHCCCLFLFSRWLSARLSLYCCLYFFSNSRLLCSP